MLWYTTNCISNDKDDNGHKEQENEPVTCQRSTIRTLQARGSCHRTVRRLRFVSDKTRRKTGVISYLFLQRNLLLTEASCRISYREMHPLRLHIAHATERGLLRHPRGVGINRGTLNCCTYLFLLQLCCCDLQPIGSIIRIEPLLFGKFNEELPSVLHVLPISFHCIRVCAFCPLNNILLRKFLLLPLIYIWQ